MQLSIVPDDNPLCSFPLTLDRTCPRPVDMTGYTGGQVPGYCDDPEHTRDAAYRKRKRLDREAAAAKQPTPSRPVTEGAAKLAALVRQLKDLRNEIAGLVGQAVEATDAIANPASVAHEVDQVRRDAEARIAEAERIRSIAEHAATVAETERDRAVTMRETATAAADEALAERDAALDRATRAIEEAKRSIATSEARARKEIDLAHSATAVAEHQRDAAVADAARAQALLDQFHAEQAAELRTLRHNR